MMRKHSPRKWLHAVLDLLPLIIIPIFAIYSHRHTIDNYAIEVPQNEVVDFNQGIENSFINNELETFGPYGLFYNSLMYPSGHKIFLRLGLSGDIQTFHINYSNGITNYDSYESTNLSNISFIKTLSQDTIYSMFAFPYENGQTIYTHNFNIYDLTQMFGSGNEPTIAEFNVMFPNDYYDYTSSAKTLVKNVGTITYDDTDIGSQFVYALYKPINKYFNLSQVGVFGQLYDFLQVNMFNGNAPISIFIVYHVILYELIMDLIFLIYCVFMFIIDFAEKMLDSFFDMSFGGGKR